MNKQVFVLCIFVFALFSGKTQNVSVEEAMSAAQNFLGKNQKSAMYCAKIAKQGADTLLYVFNTDKTFVVISATKKTIPVLAYSEEGIYDEQTVIPPVAMWLNSYQNQILSIKNSEAEATSRVTKSWKQLLEGGKNQKSNTEEVTPFLRSKWGQGKAYNYYCPKDDSATSNNGRAVTGCVATAMAQLIYYFRFPQSGTESYSYQHPKYGTLSADFGAAKYDYAQMCDEPTNPNAAIALLMSHCGIAVDMLYGYKASGMYNHSADKALKNYFKYSDATQYVFRDSVSLNWDSLIVMHLEKKIPLYYAGWSNPHTDGHAFICDGYKKDEQDHYFYHFDFGWNGSANGYFHTDTLIAGGSHFNLAQELIINAVPDTLKAPYPLPYLLVGSDTLTNESGSFTDGNGIFKPNNANRDFSWVILPDVDTIQSIQFAIHYQLSKHDTLFVETDVPALSNYVFTDTSASLAINIKGKEIKVRLKTRSGDDNSGIFQASYATVYPIYCKFEVKTQASGTLSDGSGNKKYNNLACCEKRIIPNGNYSAVIIHFKQFETEKGVDFLHIYDFSKKPKELLRSLSGNLTDSTFTFDARSLSLVFETNERNVFGGWELEYTGGYVGLPNIVASNNILQVYPNPTNEQLTINLPNPSEGGAYAADVKIYDIIGRTLTNYQFSIINSQLIIDVSHLHNGMYFLKIDNKMVKFIKL